MWRQRGPGAPRRLKTYNADTGHAWEYYFTGQEASAYRFEASAVRKDFRTVTVEIDRVQLTNAAGRELSPVEEYAVAKLSLLRAFDAREPAKMTSPVKPSDEDLASILATLDLL